MGVSMERFTAYLSAAERAEIRKQAGELGTSENYVLRLIVRERYGLTAPRVGTLRGDNRPERV